MKLNMDRKLLYKVITGVIFLVITFAVFVIKNNNSNDDWYTASKENSTEETVSGSGIENSNDKSMENIVVDIAGEVNQPSVYILPQGSRVYEGIDAAGGLTNEADTRTINLAAELSDGIKLYIPSKDEVDVMENRGEVPIENNTFGINTNVSSSTSNSIININTASKEELQKLPRIGPSMAEKIISYRNEYGRFKKKEELKNVSGIGEKTYEKLMNMITVE
ncbi:MAG: helix-hairpin-helix domain-containing protein [Anaerovoracaceae bacterium]